MATPEELHILIEANEKRYNEHFAAMDTLIKLGSDDQKEAVKAAFDAQKEAVNAALAAAKEAVNAALAAANAAVNKAEIAAGKQFESVNEFRNTLSDQQLKLLPRAEADIKFNSLDKAIDNLVKMLADMRLADTKLQTTESFEIRHSELQRQVNDLKDLTTKESGKDEGSKTIYAYIIAAVSVIIGLLGLISRYIPMK